MREDTRSSSWRGVRPSGPGWVMPASIWRQMPATRTMKNSSQLLDTMLRNFTRSSRGTVESSASSITRALKSSQLSSRLSSSSGRGMGWNTAGPLGRELSACV